MACLAGIGLLATESVAGAASAGLAGAGLGATIGAAEIAGGLTALSGGALGAAGALGGGAFGAGDIAGLTQMGQDAGLTGQALTDFVNGGGTAGSFGEGGLGVGTGAGAGDPWTSGFGANAAGSSGFFSGDTFNSALKLASPVSSIFSGIQGLSQADQMKRRAQQAQISSNPWAAGGGQGMANQQLMSLLADPGAVAQNDPAYKLRIQGAQRATATQGQGSGAMAVAGANASTDWYNARLQQLGGLAGAPGNPVGAAQVGLQGDIAAGDLTSRGLASIGFGTNQLTGGGAAAAMPPQVKAWLSAQGYL